MAVWIDAIGALQGTNVSGTSFNYSGITVGSPTNSALVLFLNHNASANPSAITVHWDSAGTNQAMTLVGSASTSGIRARTYCLLNPTPGNKNLAVTWTTADTVGMGAVSLGGVLQTSIATAFLNQITATYSVTNTPSLSVTCSTPGTDMVLAQCTSNQAFNSGPGFTDLWNAIMWTGGYYAFADAVQAAASPQVFNWNISGAATTGSLIGLEAQWDGSSIAPGPTGPTDQGMVVCEW